MPAILCCPTATRSPPGHQIDLVVGENVFKIRVTAEDNLATETYVVSVTRTEADTSLSPSASDPSSAFASSAVYRVTFTGAWTSSATPDGLPSGAHFSPLIGGVHNANVTFVEGGGTASAGVESMAELGGTAGLEAEVTAAMADALSVLRGSGNISPTRTQSLTTTLTSEHPRVTLLTMVAPSPDWFVGVSGLLLLNSEGRWLRSHEVELYPWDAGTEDGGEFSLTNDATVPPGVITSIRGTGKFSTEPIATPELHARIGQHHPQRRREHGGWRGHRGAGRRHRQQRRSPIPWAEPTRPHSRSSPRRANSRPRPRSTTRPGPATRSQSPAPTRMARSPPPWRSGSATSSNSQRSQVRRWSRSPRTARAGWRRSAIRRTRIGTASSG